MTASNSAIARSALHAARLISESGWLRDTGAGRFENFPTASGNRCYCPITALPANMVTLAAIEFALWLGMPPGPAPDNVDCQYFRASDYIISWNDSHSSAEPVIAALLAFAAHMNSEEKNGGN